MLRQLARVSTRATLLHATHRPHIPLAINNIAPHRLLCTGKKEEPSSQPEEKAADDKQQSSSSTDETDAALRSRVLEAAMLEVPNLGWTMDALTAGAAACDLSPMAHGLLPRGPVELVEHFSAECDAKLAAELTERAAEFAGLEVHNRLLVAMQARLRMVAPHATTWPQALALRALPANLPNTLRDGHNLAEQLLAACGEDGKAPLMPPPIDPFVKTLSVGAIYGAAELHLLTDSSPGLNDTWTFLEREVEALRTVASVKSRLPDLSPVSLLLNLMARR